MAIVSSNKVVTPQQTPLNCDGLVEIELNLTAVKSLIANPIDIMLLLDESASMQGQPLESLKTAIKKFIDIIDESTNNGQITGTFSGGTRMGVVEFSTSASFINPPGLTNDANGLKEGLDTLVASGFTCHGCAFKVGRESFDFSSTNPKIMILITDGRTTVNRPSPDSESSIAKSEGIEIYCVGIGDAINRQNLIDWATDENYVLFVPSAEDLEELFEELAESLEVPGATNIDITEYIGNDFEIVENSETVEFSTNTIHNYTTSISSDKKSINLKVDNLGVSEIENMQFKFKVKHISLNSGNKLIDRGTTYSDNEGNTVFFLPERNYVEVNCNTCEDVTNCTPVTPIKFDSCEKYKNVTITALTNGGRILNVFVNLNKICPNSKLAIGVLLYEKVSESIIPRGIRTLEISTPSEVCNNLKVGPFEFIIPEQNNLSYERQFYAKVISHYIDNESYDAMCEINDLYKVRNLPYK